MTKGATVTTRVPPTLKRKLESLARSTSRTEAYLAREAIAAYVELNEWQVAQIEERLAEVRAGAPMVAHEDVKLWLDAKRAGRRRRTPRPRP